MKKQQAEQLVKLLSIIRDTDHQTVGIVIAFLMQGDFTYEAKEKEK